MAITIAKPGDDTVGKIKEDGTYVGADGIPFQFLEGHVLPDDVLKSLKKVGPFGGRTEAKVNAPVENKANPNPAAPIETAAQKKAREKAEKEAAEAAAKEQAEKEAAEAAAAEAALAGSEPGEAT